MRLAALTLIGSLALAGVTGSANAAPAIPNLPEASNLIQVAGGCGRGYHTNAWGHCVPSYYRPPVWHGGYYGPYYRGPYYGGYYPRWHHRVYW